MALFCSKTCRNKLVQQEALINRFKLHESIAYGLPDLTNPNNALKLNGSDVQRMWKKYGVEPGRQHMMGRSWYAPKYVDVCKFVGKNVSYLTHGIQGEFDCSDFSMSLMSERMSLGLFGVTNLEWYLAIIGRISGQYIAKPISIAPDGKLNHAWNWFICMEKPDAIFFIDYFKPNGNYFQVSDNAYVSLYTPETHGPVVNWDVYW